MFFHSPNFLVFFLVLLVPYFLMRRSRVWLLAVANAVFYGASGFGLLVIFFTISIVTFAAMHLMRRPRLGWMFWVGIAANVGNLAFFKYTMFLLSTWEGVTGLSTGFLGAEAARIVLPVGISFYTFQLISYLIDVRRGKTEPTRSFVRFWVYIALFPPLIAGPIMRGNELLPQLDELSQKRIRWEEVRYGLYLTFVGLIKKVVIADQLKGIVVPLFDKGDAMTSAEAWIASYAFGFQIYFDFSSYSDMAFGLAMILGIRLVYNFRTPYLSSNPSEFWSRWHMSLSRWIRDYIYIGLGGNRKGAARTQFNLLAAMLISGLWHGAMWTFVMWGAVHGVLLIVYKWTMVLNRWEWIARLRENAVYRVAAIVVFFHVVTMTWVFFRAQSMELAWSMIGKMVRVNPMDVLAHPVAPVIAGLFALHVFEFVLQKYEVGASRVWHWVPFPLRSAVYFALIMAVFYFTRGDVYEFIYFQF